LYHHHVDFGFLCAIVIKTVVVVGADYLYLIDGACPEEREFLFSLGNRYRACYIEVIVDYL
jgi:hypothetical protein